MAVTVRIPTTLRPLSGGSSTVQVEGATLAEVIANLDAAHPGFNDRLLDDSGSLRKFVNLFVADDDVRYLDGLATATPEGTTVSIIPAVAGGHARVGHNAWVAGQRNIDAQLLAEALLHAPVAWALFDLDAHGIAGSREYASVFELTPDDLAGLPFEAMIEPDDLDHTTAVMGQLARRETEEYIAVLTAQRPGGGEQLVRLTMRPLLRGDTPVALFSTVVPLTDEAKVHSQLIATVSHELRNPLHAMCGLAELLTTSPDLGDGASALAHTLRRQIEGLTTVLDDLLDSSRLGLGAVVLSQQSVLLRPLIDDVVAMATQGARGRPVQVSAEFGDGTPDCVAGDAPRLRQVLGNLMGNAVKFTSDGEVVLRVAPVGDGLRFDVVDSGKGIAIDELFTVFEPFTTGTNAGDAAGAGLGLTVVRQLVELMGGDITAHSRPGMGATFTVTLPLVATDPPLAVAQIAPPLATTGQRVLVVEDDAVNQMLAESQLARLGLQSLVVGTGEAALELMARDAAPSVVLMDYHLPGIDGVEATRLIRTLEAGTERHAVIIGVTAAATAADRRACEEAGMDDFLPKPVSLAVLGEALRRWMHHVAVGELPDTVDASVLDSLAADLGDTAVVVDLVTTFLDELQGRRTALADATAEGDLPSAKRAAHTLKSSSQLLGALELGRACQRMETVETADGAARTSDEILRQATDAARWYQIWLGRQPS